MNATLHSYRLLLLLGLSVLVVSGLGAGWLFSGGGNESNSEAKVTVATTAPTAGPRTVVCFGQVDLERGCTPLTPLTPGRVVEVCVTEGEAVKDGQPLLRLDDGPAQARVEEATAALAGAEALLEKVRALPFQHALGVKMQQDAVQIAAGRVIASRLALELKQDMRRANLGSAREIPLAEEAVKEAESLHAVELKKLEQLTNQDTQSDIKRAEAEVAAAEARLRQARQAVAECTLKAPRAGSVARIQTTVGEVLGAPGRPPAVIFAAAEPRVVRAEVEQEFAGEVAVGQKVKVQDDINAKVTFTGTVLRVSDWFLQRRTVFQEPTRYNDTRTVECVVALDAGHPPLRIGQRVRVIINPTEP